MHPFFYNNFLKIESFDGNLGRDVVRDAVPVRGNQI